MAKNFFSGNSIDTLKNLRHLVSTFSKQSGSVTVVSKARIESQWVTWNKALPNVKPYYAVKSNPEPILLQELIRLGADFDCASLREVRDVKACSHAYDSQPPDILYAHPLKSDRDIGVIGQEGIRCTVVDSAVECLKLSKAKWKGSALLRVAVNDKESKMPFSMKFGASEMETRLISMYSMIPLTGVSFHVGSGCDNPLQYKEAIEYSLKNVFNALLRHRHNPLILDIGGGFSSDPADFLKTAKVIKDSLINLSNHVSVIAEPGRFFAQPSQDLFVKVIAKKPGVNGIGWRYVVDESLYGHFSCIPFDHQKPAWFRIPNYDREKRGQTDAILFGRTCDSLDVIAKGPMEELEVGDWLYFPLMGAYTSATASEFNGFPKPEIVEDTEKILPDVTQAWEWVREFHAKNSNLQYSNALVPII